MKKSDTRIPITNNDPVRNMHVAGKVIRPGETRHIEAHLVPSELPKGNSTGAVNPEASTANPMKALSREPVAAIVDRLTTLSEEQLTELYAIESGEEGKGRKGVLEAIAAEQLHRASPGDLP